MTNAPLLPGTATLSTSPLNTVFSGETIFNLKPIVDTIYDCKLLGLCLGHQLLALGLGVFDGSYVEECLLWQVIHFTVENGVEALDGLLDGHHHTWQTCELLCHGERLRQETLHTTCTVHGKFVLV